MSDLVFALLVVILYGIVLVLLIKTIRGNIRAMERERNVHNKQVSELLDRIAHAEGRPWTLPPRPVEPLPEEPEVLEHDWREV